MKKKVLFILIVVFSLVSCGKQERRIRSVQSYIEELAKSSSNAGVKFPFEVVKNISIPDISNHEDVFYFENSILGDIMYWFNGLKYTIKPINISTGEIQGTISFPQVSDLTNHRFAKAELLGNQYFVWYADSNLMHVYDINGTYERTIDIPLTNQGKRYIIATSPTAHIEYYPNENSIVFPINCVDEYDDKEIYNLPQFAMYNFQTRSVQFLPIYLPKVYPADKPIGNLMMPISSKDNNNFYVAYPLSSTVYKYNVKDGSLETITLNIPVSLTSPAQLTIPSNYQQMIDIEYGANRINGMAVVNGIIYIQQTDAWDANLASKKYVDNTVLYAFNSNGHLEWSGSFPQNEFDNIGVFRLSSANMGRLNFLSFNKHNEKRFIQLIPKL